ncbi:MAG: hypothetical protein M1376_04940 [Planctomycetes bacterium]|nr:hypothetical protein [Planctomycetota bacterium]
MRNTYYGKLFPETYSGSMFGAGLAVFAVWPWIIAHKDENGIVELNPDLVAAQLGCVTQQVEEAIAYLIRPDPRSRTKTEDGRRIVRVSEFGYRVVNHESYQKRGSDRTRYWREWRANKRKGTADERREEVAQQDAQRESVAQRCAQPMSTPVTAPAPAPAKERNSPTESKETPTAAPRDPEDSDESRRAGRARSGRPPADSSRKRFEAPTVEQVQTYITANPELSNVDAGAFVAFFEAGDPPWTDSRGKPVKNWKQKLRTWSNRNGHIAPARQFDRDHQHRQSAIGETINV